MPTLTDTRYLSQEESIARIKELAGLAAAIVERASRGGSLGIPQETLIASIADEARTSETDAKIGLLAGIDQGIVSRDASRQIITTRLLDVTR